MYIGTISFNSKGDEKTTESKKTKGEKVYIKRVFVFGNPAAANAL